jgi:hypothetical protein
MKSYIKKFIKVVITVIIFAILAQIIHSASAYFTMDYYTNPDYSGVWSSLMMPEDGAPGINFYITSILFSLIGAMLYTIVYIIIRASIPGRSYFKKGLFYGLFLFLIAGIPGFLSLYLLINLPTILLYIWVLENFIVYIIGGVVIAEINR